jgi:hypothetical protein
VPKFWLSVIVVTLNPTPLSLYSLLYIYIHTNKSSDTTQLGSLKSRYIHYAHKVLTYAHKSLKKAECEKGGRAGLTFFLNFTISSCKCLRQVALVFKTEMDNPFSNFTWSITGCISSKWNQTWSIPVLHASLNTPLSLKQWLISDTQKSVIHPSKRNIFGIIQEVWSTTFFMLNLRWGLLPLSRENPCPTKSDTFHGGWSILFSKNDVWKKRQLFDVLNWRMPHEKCR